MGHPGRNAVIANGNSFSNGHSMDCREGTEREAPLWRWLLRVIEPA